jgi:glycosyltransferase involved in cell wall biosynthesis
MIKKISEGEQIKNFTGFGLYDKSFIEILRNIEDPYPYFRGLIGELGYDRAEIEFRQPVRKSGKTKNNFYTLYDIAMLGFVSHSKVPLRVASFLGFTVSFLSILTALAYFVYKLIYWDNFKLGMAPMVIGMFFLGGIQLFFLGMIGEYVGSIFTQVRKRPLVVEAERINF